MGGTIIGWVLFGLVAGLTARVLHPNPEDLGWGATSLLGIGGAMAGGWVAHQLGIGTSPDQVGGWVLALAGAIGALTLGQSLKRPRITV